MRNEVSLKRFKYLSEYIRNNKALVERMNKFRMIVYGKIFFFTCNFFKQVFNMKYMDKLVKKVQKELGEHSKWKCFRAKYGG